MSIALTANFVSNIQETIILAFKMAELQSTDGSIFSQTDEEKSLESIEDMFSMIAEIGKETDKNVDRENFATDIGNGNGKDTTKRRTATVDARKSDITNEVGKEKKKKTEIRSHRNESTLIAIKRHLNSGNCFSDTLEYEEVSAFNSKIHLYAVERTRGRQGMFFRDETIQNGEDTNVKIHPIVMTEEDIAQERSYQHIYQKEEYYAVATKFLKNVIDGAHDTGGPEFVLHTKTANWLKRAAGMQRQYDPYEKDDNQQRIPVFSEDSDEGDGEAVSGGVAGGNDRRITRRRVQMTRKKRRLERMEKETESFRILSYVALELSKQMRTGRTKKGLKRGFSMNDINDGDEYHKIPKDINESTSEQPFPSLESTGLATIYSPYFRCVDGEKRLPHKMQGSILPSVVARLGLEFRPLPLGLDEGGKSFPLINDGKTIDGALYGTITDRARVRKSKKLINALSNKRARCWAMYEFFYSDMDKDWYRNDGFASDLAKHGFPIDSRTRLTRQEWSLIRRKLRPRSRVFSKRFIAEQLSRRNRHRALVRKLQQDPKADAFVPIAPGTRVTAFDKRSHTIRRGRILLHDSTKHCYLVQFDDKDSGCDVCPDFEVAISLPTTTRNNRVTPSHPSLYEPHQDFSSTKVENKGAIELVIRKGNARDGFKEDIERELLISSIAVATEAFERKRDILEALESCVDSTIRGASNHYSHLLANLDRINSTLEAALTYLQVLYGKVYGSPVWKHETPKAKVEKMKLGAEIPKSKEFEELLVSLVSISNKVGAVAVSSSDDGKKSKILSTSESLRNDLSGSTSLLLLSNYLAETSSLLTSSENEKITYSKAMNAVLKILFDRYSKNCLPPTPEALLMGGELEQESRVEEELGDLSVAVGMLRTEAALATDESRAFELSNSFV